MFKWELGANWGLYCKVGSGQQVKVWFWGCWFAGFLGSWHNFASVEKPVGPLAQLAEQLTFNQLVGGSSPPWLMRVCE